MAGLRFSEPGLHVVRVPELRKGVFSFSGSWERAGPFGPGIVAVHYHHRHRLCFCLVTLSRLFLHFELQSAACGSETWYHHPVLKLKWSECGLRLSPSAKRFNTAVSG